ncbi:MAG: NADH-quinone oxidoreductase subunit H [Calditrichaeota bacterium]|nr:NADH-quinone oxidoreductase subunit H [Candidatus Cloacimonadota bacterium]MCA9784962.1 NADH-quinone oxidoreductase subunit H [Candidatus Cloacimonadota bacterium]MCB1046015.1 NADH-quinone oxidoreductase subunit H [Calditrichota bacterium]MCB9473117.1 NADH-quinone oxidoreductase subunit H [Candidatus Delongbacteria bacterium]
MHPMLFATLVALAKIVLILFMFIMAIATLLTWAERKQSAVLQDRIGANRADFMGFRLWGLLNIAADGIKSFTKEDWVPPTGNPIIHNLAPFIGLFGAMVSFAVIPFGPPLQLFGQTFTLQLVDLNIGLLYILAFGSMGIYSVVLAGWSSNNKFAQLGALRGICQMISYEVVLGLSLIGVILVTGSVRLPEIIAYQGQYWLGGWIPKWGIFTQPLAFLLFLPAAIAETKRVPFDVPEGESEIIGYFVEYSGLKFGLFLLGEFIEIVVLAAFISVLFFGGWQVPWLTDAGFQFGSALSIPLSEWLVATLRILGFIAKVIFFCMLQLQIRWTLPRFRFDHLLRLGWKEMMPLALLNVFITAIVMYVLS